MSTVKATNFVSWQIIITTDTTWNFVIILLKTEHEPGQVSSKERDRSLSFKPKDALRLFF
jgi:hypothetical protein